MILTRFIALLSLILIACNPDKKVDTRSVKEEMGKYKIKKITPGEIMSQAEQKGLLLIDSIQLSINKKLDSALKSGSVKKALAFCVLSANPYLKLLEKRHHAHIYRAGFPGKLRNTANSPDSLQAMVLDGYQYSIENNLQPAKDISMGDHEIIINNPIFLNEKSCLRCHGEKGKDIPEHDYQEILSLYPQDKSTGFKPDEPIGVWTVRFRKEDFIREMK